LAKNGNSLFSIGASIYFNSGIDEQIFLLIRFNPLSQLSQFENLSGFPQKPIPSAFLPEARHADTRQMLSLDPATTLLSRSGFCQEMYLHIVFPWQFRETEYQQGK